MSTTATETILKDAIVDEIHRALPSLRFPRANMTMTYDGGDGADVLYIAFAENKEATHSRMLDDGILVRYRNRRVIGLTIMEASKR